MGRSATIVRFDLKSVKQQLIVSEKRNAAATRVERSLQTPADAVFEVRIRIKAGVAAQVAEHLAANGRDVEHQSIRGRRRQKCRLRSIPTRGEGPTRRERSLQIKTEPEVLPISSASPTGIPRR